MKLLTKKIGILGYGVEGKSLAKFLQSRRVRDMKIYDERNPAFPNFSEMGDRDVVFRSPGIPPHHPALQSFSGKVMGGTELFLQLCPTKKVIGVTGSKGKGTTSTLITRIFEEANDTVYLVGNIGHPFFDSLPDIRTRDVVVAELSSFQLWDCQQSPQIAVLLRMAPDHLEVHKSFEEYIEAKKNIFLHQKSGAKVVYCADCPIASAMVAELADDVKVAVSVKNELSSGVFIREGKIIWKTPEAEEEIVSVSDVRLPGEHNLENVLAAVAAAKQLNARTIPIATAIAKFTGLPFRQQLVAANRDNIRFWNDSYATNPIATVAALATFKEPVVLITGGFDKKFDYDMLGKAIASNEHLKAVLFMGETGPAIRGFAEKYGTGQKQLIDAHDLKGVFSALKALVAPGDHVLFSPASASFDQFENVKDRGEKWNQAVNEFLKVL